MEKRHCVGHKDPPRGGEDATLEIWQKNTARNLCSFEALTYGYHYSLHFVKYKANPLHNFIFFSQGKVPVKHLPTIIHY